MQTPTWSSRRLRREPKPHRVRAAGLLIVTVALAGVLIGAAAAVVAELVFTWAQGLSG